MLFSTNLSQAGESPESQFYWRHLVDASDGFFRTGTVLGHVAVAMLVVWAATFALVAWGPRAFAWVRSLWVNIVKCFRWRTSSSRNLNTTTCVNTVLPGESGSESTSVEG